MKCDHRGTIWLVTVTDATLDAGGYECTRCGVRWDEDPRGDASPTPSL